MATAKVIYKRLQLERLHYLSVLSTPTRISEELSHFKGDKRFWKNLGGGSQKREQQTPPASKILKPPPLERGGAELPQQSSNNCKGNL